MRERAICLVILAVVAVSCATESQATTTTSATTTTATTATSTTTVATSTQTTSATTTTTSLVEVPSGYEVVGIEGENVRLALPEAWVVVDLTQEGWEELLSEGLAAFPDAAELIGEEGEAIISQGGLLLAYDVEHQDEDFVTNLNILSVERGPLDDAEIILPVLTEQFEQIGVVDTAIDLVELPSGAAIKASYGLPPETGFTHTAVQYYVFAPDAVYIVTFSTEDIIDLEFVFETVMSTFDVTD